MKCENTIRYKFAVGKTINLGNYESLRVDIGYEIPIESPDFDLQSFQNRVYSELEEVALRLTELAIRKRS